MRQNLWDAENRIRAVNLKPDDVTSHPIAIYTYNAGGERTVRYNYDHIGAFSNEQKAGQVSKDNVMLYPSGLLMGKAYHTNDKERIDRIRYTKHYYVGNERISAKTGTEIDLGMFPVNLIGIEMPQLNAAEIRNKSKAIVFETAPDEIIKVHEIFNVPAPALDPMDELDKIRFNHDQKMLDIFYFHPDHLGISSYITNLDGVVSQHMEYLPFGETMVDEHLNSRNSPFKYNGKEFDEETGNYYYGARYYDPKWSIWVSVDPLVEKTMDAYGYCYQNPINLIDPTGMEATENDGWIKNKWTGEVTYDENVTGPENTPSNSTYLCQECTLSELPFQSFGVVEYLKGDNLNGDGSRNHVIQLNEIFIGDINSLDPSTVGQNFFNLTYPGPNNPRTYAKDYDYSFIPTDPSEFPAIGHDRRYDKLNIKGSSGLFLDTRAIGADWKFVKEELTIAMKSKSRKTRYRAGILGTGLGLASLPKTILALSTQQGLNEALMWYSISSSGVTNNPSK